VIRRSLFSFLAFMLLFCSAKASTFPNRFLDYNLEAPITFNHLGLNFGLNAMGSYQNHNFWLGANAPLSNTFVPVSMPLGLTLGYSFFFLENEGKFKSFAMLEYFRNVYEFSNNLSNEKLKNTIHQLYGGLGVSYSVTNNFRLNGALGVGAFFENVIDGFQQEEFLMGGMSSIIRIGALYKF
jgi:hypothetical protein